MSSIPSMPLFCNDYFGATQHLSAEQSGCYLHILMATWNNAGRALPDDDVYLSRICRMTVARWRSRIRPALTGFFDLSRGTWRSPRLEQEWAYVQRAIAIKRANGAKGGRPRANGPPDGPQNDSKIHPETCTGLNATEEANPLKSNGSAKATGSSTVNLEETTHPHTDSLRESLIEDDAGARAQERAVEVGKQEQAVEVGRKVAALAGMTPDPNGKRDYGPVLGWLEQGADPGRDIFPTVERVVDRAGTVRIHSLRYFTEEVLLALKNRTAPIPALPPREGSRRHAQYHRVPVKGQNATLEAARRFYRGCSDDADSFGVWAG